jgi:hypothetical protein
MPRKESHVLHNITQYLIFPLLIIYFSLYLFPGQDVWDVVAVTFFGSMFPDTDHINIWFEYKFKNFRAFIRFVTSARRYRYSFLIFHNIAGIIVAFILIPILGAIEILAGIFMASFFIHLILDFFDDKISIKRVTHWRYRRRT